MNAKHTQLAEAVSPAILGRNAVQEDIDRRRATRNEIQDEIPALRAEKEALQARFAEEDTERAVAKLPLSDRTPEDTAAQQAIDRNLVGKSAAIGILDQQIERLTGDLAEREVNLNDAFLTWASSERHYHSAAITAALEKVTDHVIQLRAVDVLQETLLPSPFRFTEPGSPWALTSGRWLTDKLASLPAELRPISLTSDHLEAEAQQRAAQLLTAIQEDK